MHAFLRALVLFACVVCGAAKADSATIAVASNFIVPLEALAEAFSARTGHELIVVGGSTGQLHAQITNGAPFDVFLSADQERPQALIDAGLADGGTRFTYAVGLLVLWSRQPGLAADLDVLGSDRYRWLAIANPDLAPYGAAAVEALEQLGHWPKLQSRTVYGQNIGQTFAMVQTGNAELGLIARSQALAYTGPASYVDVPSSLHEPIRQDAVALPRGAGNTAARAFLEFLRSDEARDIVESFGYGVPE